MLLTPPAPPCTTCRSQGSSLVCPGLVKFSNNSKNPLNPHMRGKKPLVAITFVLLIFIHIKMLEKRDLVIW